jgi:hypothetical protein
VSFAPFEWGTSGSPLELPLGNADHTRLRASWLRRGKPASAGAILMCFRSDKTRRRIPFEVREIAGRYAAGVWVTHPNQDVVTRTDPASAAVTAEIPVPVSRLFGVAAGGGSVWAVTDEALVRIDPATNRAVAKAAFPRATPVGFTGVAVGGGAVWATNYDRGELYRVNPPSTARAAERSCADERAEDHRRGALRPRACAGNAATGAPALSVSYSVSKRFGLDRNKDGLVDYHDSVVEVQPRGWPVDFRIARCDRSAKYRWTVAGKPAAFASTGRRCAWRHTFGREGTYAVRVRDAKRAGTIQVVVQDWLVVGLGRLDRIGRRRAGSGRRRGRWEDRGCHRSARSFQAIAALALENGDARTSVTFVHLACSGATMDDVVAKQLAEVRRLAGSRELDAVVASVGANDLKFGPLVQFCVTQPDCSNAAWGGGQTLAQLMPAGLRSSRAPMPPSPPPSGGSHRPAGRT